jgi:hypothetical protein
LSLSEGEKGFYSSNASAFWVCGDFDVSWKEVVAAKHIEQIFP